jgi:hypothetical protein
MASADDEVEDRPPLKRPHPDEGHKMGDGTPEAPALAGKSGGPLKCLSCCRTFVFTLMAVRRPCRCASNGTFRLHFYF